MHAIVIQADSISPPESYLMWYKPSLITSSFHQNSGPYLVGQSQLHCLRMGDQPQATVAVQTPQLHPPYLCVQNFITFTYIHKHNHVTLSWSHICIWRTCDKLGTHVQLLSYPINQDWGNCAFSSTPYSGGRWCHLWLYISHVHRVKGGSRISGLDQLTTFSKNVFSAHNNRHLNRTLAVQLYDIYVQYTHVQYTRLWHSYPLSSVPVCCWGHWTHCRTHLHTWQCRQSSTE